MLKLPLLILGAGGCHSFFGAKKQHPSSAIIFKGMDNVNWALLLLLSTSSAGAVCYFGLVASLLTENITAIRISNASFRTCAGGNLYGWFKMGECVGEMVESKRLRQ